MGKRQFKAETKQLLDLMVNSIYTHKEIFLRELISNASDAIDKVKFRSLTEPEILGGDGDFKIFIAADRVEGTLTVSDNGIGMTFDEVVENIGTIAKSGSKEFFEKLGGAKSSENTAQLIGQFGVGFYASFMAADKVVLTTKAPGEAKGVRWESAGDGSYIIDAADIEKRGTTVTLYLKKDLRESTDMDFLDQEEIQELVKKYSDYIRYPVMMNFVTEHREEKDKDGNITKEKSVETELRTLNSMVPIWQKSKADVKDDDYKQFYHHAFRAWDEPLDIIHTKGEGQVEYTSLIFIPEKVPMEFYSSHYERGLKLFSKQVFIMEKCKELLPEYLGFVRGLVDSPDFNLNISREILQHDRQLKVIAKNIEKKILSSLKYMLENDRPKYEKFWKEFGKAIKAGVYANFGANKADLQDLLLFSSSRDEALVTFKEYVSRMPETQKEIYYATGKDRATIELMPQMEMVRDKGYEVIYFTDKIDEFMSTILMEYDKKRLRSIASDEIELDAEAEAKEKKEKKQKKEEENKDILSVIKGYLDGKVSEVRFSTRLKSAPACITSGADGISINMEQVLMEANFSEMPGPKAKRVLELNPDHAVFGVVKRLHDADAKSAKLKTYSGLLYNQALLTEGLPIDNPAEFASQIAMLMEEAGK